MSSTLSSRLKVLVAKSFKAERLYGSMVLTLTDKQESELAERAKLTNEIKAREWQKSYNKLRIGLNSILSEETNIISVTERLLKLDAEFRAQVISSNEDLEKISLAIKEALTRGEYAVVYRRAMDLVKYQSIIQASQVISEEILALLETKKAAAPIIEAKLAEVKSAEVQEESPREKSKVIPFMRKVSA